MSIDFELNAGKECRRESFHSWQTFPRQEPRSRSASPGLKSTIKNGDIEDPSIYSAREATDETGRFHFPAQDKNFQLVITHPSGFAHIKSTPDWDLTKIIHLEPWSRVEGIFRIGKSLAPNVPLQLDVVRLVRQRRMTPRFSFNTNRRPGRMAGSSSSA